MWCETLCGDLCENGPRHWVSHLQLGSNFSVAVVKLHGHGNLYKEGFIWGYSFRGIGPSIPLGNIAMGKQAWHRSSSWELISWSTNRKQRDGEDRRLLKPYAHLQWQTSSNKGHAFYSFPNGNQIGIEYSDVWDIRDSFFFFFYSNYHTLSEQPTNKY